MPSPDLSSHAALDAYYATLARIHQQNLKGEEHTRIAFSSLLDTLSRQFEWTFVPEVRQGNNKKPDGSLLDVFNIPRGHWEAKDLADDLDKEIEAKKKLRYPLRNIIFENTQRAVLYQNEREAGKFDLTQPPQLARLLEKFFGHTDEDKEGFKEAVAEFHSRIPILANALQTIIHKEAEGSDKFKAAFAAFHDLCKGALDPNVSAGAIEEMLVQHLLTERLFRTVFGNSEFRTRNVIAAEIETTIHALTARSFNREKFLQTLDPFYKAIEDTGRTIDDWSDKQRFLNTVYERFFQGYSVNQADTHGIVYTPQEIVDWMCASVEAVLTEEFDATLSKRGLKILDPCVGTGNFIVNLMGRISAPDLAHKYKHDIFANEIMLLPYYIAGQNIEHKFWEEREETLPFPGLCFVDTLDLFAGGQASLFEKKNTERVEREKEAELFVIVGNPPYNVGQKNENDNNKNRKYELIDKAIKATYAKDSKATNKNALSDAYVKFFKWASERLGGKDGVVCFVTNNSFVNQNSLDGMRKHLAQDFNHIYHLDLHGNVRQNPKLSGTTHNVFGIQVGVGITVAIRNSNDSTRFIKYHRVPEMARRIEKLEWLTQTGDIRGVQWQQLTPNVRNAWLTEGLQDDFESFLPMGSKEAKASFGVTVKAIFKSYCRGVETTRDEWVYDFQREKLEEDVRQFTDFYNSEVTRWQNSDQKTSIDNFVSYDNSKIKWSSSLKAHLKRGTVAKFDVGNVRQALYRPFSKQFLYFDQDVLVHRPGLHPRYFPTPKAENQMIVVSDVAYRAPFSVLMTNAIPDLHLLASSDGFQCFPFYTYSPDGENRTENITDWALEQFRAAFGAEVSKWDVFYFVYARLHDPAYRLKYGENLKRDLPRLPLSGDFHAISAIGHALAKLHLDYETLDEFPLVWKTTKPFSYRVEKLKWNKDKTAITLNASFSLEGIPPAALDYRLGNRSALDWIVDQYQVKTDARSGLESDPNRAEDEEYIARLIGRVTTVSVETMKLVGQLG